MKVYKRSDYDFFHGLDKNAVPVLETDSEIQMDDLLSIRGKLYTVCIRTEDMVFVKELNVLSLDEPEEMYGEDEIKCPYCQSDILDSFEMPDEEEEYECPYCHSIFSYQRNVEVTYDSQPISKAEPKVLA